MSDLIDRAEAVMALRLEYPMMPMFKSLREEWAIKTEGFRKAEEVIMKLPSARPRKGKWLEAGRMTQFNQFYYFRYCSKCFYARDDCDSEKDTNFCPNCGADMRESRERRE